MESSRTIGSVAKDDTVLLTTFSDLIHNFIWPWGVWCGGGLINMIATDPRSRAVDRAVAAWDLPIELGAARNVYVGHC